VRKTGPSHTAAAVAFRRAAHQRLDLPTVFTDPLAARLLSPEAQARLDAAPARRDHTGFGARLRAFLAVRSRVAEDQLATAFAAGVRQYLILGAGLDTFAYRNPFPGLRVFEVDHPSTQAWKLDRVRAAGLTPAPGTTYVPVDFERQRVADALATHGFDPTASTAIAWLGVVPYLDASTIWATFAWAGTIIGPRGHIVFDYGSAPRWWQLRQQLALWMLARRVAAAGEPFKSRLHPDQVRRQLAAAGFGSIVDLDSPALNARYFGARHDGLKVSGTAHVVVASR
jgi:methyltransferase (TIGR00027 family)